MKLRINKECLNLYIIIYITLMVFSSLFSSSVITLFQIVNNLIIFATMKHYYNIPIVLIIMMIINIPASYISIIGTDFSSLPLTWFMIYSIILFLYTIFNCRFDKITLITTVISIIYLLLHLLLFNLSFDGFKQFAMIVLFLFSFIVGESISKKTNSPKIIEILSNMYLIATLSTSLQIFIQYFFINQFEIIIGNFNLYGGGRSAYSGLFNDNSFVGIFIASGILFMIIRIVKNNSHTFKDYIYLLVNLIALLLCSSRTGLYALIIILCFFLGKTSIHGNTRSLLLIFLALLFIPFILDYVLNSRGTSLLDDSGRINDFAIAFNYIQNHFLFGLGLGLDEVVNITKSIIPHNFFIQYMLQIGIIGTVLILSHFILLFKYKSYNYVYVIYFILLSAMAVPDIVSSRFFSVIIILYYIDAYQVRMSFTKGDTIYDKRFD